MNAVNCYITGNLALAEKAPDYFARALRVYYGLTATEAAIVTAVAACGGFAFAADLCEPLGWGDQTEAMWRATCTHRSNLRYRYGIDLRVVRRSPVPALAFDWYDCWGPVQGPRRPAHTSPRYGRGSPVSTDVGLALDAYRRRYNLTTARLAERLRVRRGTLSGWLHGHARPGPEAMARIHSLLQEERWTRAK